MRSPRGDNTIAASLVPAWLSPSVLNVLSDKLAPLNALAMTISPSPLAPRSTVLVSKVTVGSTPQTNPTDWESGDSTAEGVSVMVNQLGNSFHLSNDALQQGHRNLMSGFEAAAANNLANAVSDTWTPLLQTTNFTSIVVGAAADFSVDEMSAIYEAARNFNSPTVVLDHAYLSKLIPINKTSLTASDAQAFGFEGIYTQNRWTGAASTVVGLVSDPTGGIAAVSGPPLAPPGGQFMSRSTMTLPGIGLPVEASQWFNTQTRATWAALSIMFGASVGESSKLVLLVSA